MPACLSPALASYLYWSCEVWCSQPVKCGKGESLTGLRPAGQLCLYCYCIRRSERCLWQPTKSEGGILASRTLYTRPAHCQIGCSCSRLALAVHSLHFIRWASNVSTYPERISLCEMRTPILRRARVGSRCSNSSNTPGHTREPLYISRWRPLARESCMITCGSGSSQCRSSVSSNVVADSSEPVGQLSCIARREMHEPTRCTILRQTRAIVWQLER